MTVADLFDLHPGKTAPEHSTPSALLPFVCFLLCSGTSGSLLISRATSIKIKETITLPAPHVNGQYAADAGYARFQIPRTCTAGTYLRAASHMSRSCCAEGALIFMHSAPSGIPTMRSEGINCCRYQASAPCSHLAMQTMSSFVCMPFTTVVRNS